MNQSVFPIFLLGIIAFIYQRVVQPNINQITHPVLFIFVPVFIFYNLIKQDIKLLALFTPFVFMILLTGSLILLAYLASLALRFSWEHTIGLMLSCSMINVGNFGLPLIYFTYGQEAVSYSLFIFIVFNIPLGTLAIYLVSPKARLQEVGKDIIRIPIFNALIIALLFTALDLSLPECLNKGLSLLAQAAIPLLIFILGLQLANITIKNRFKEFGIIVTIAICIRLVISPVIAFYLTSFLSFTELERNVAIVQTAGPTALLPLMYAIKFQRSPDLLSIVVLTSTLLSGISLPLVIDILGPLKQL